MTGSKRKMAYLLVKIIFASFDSIVPILVSSIGFRDKRFLVRNSLKLTAFYIDSPVMSIISINRVPDHLQSKDKQK